MKPKKSLLSILLSSCGLLAAAPTAHAAILYWDGASTSADADGGNGTWNTGTNWDNAATGGADTAWNNTTPDSAVFGGVAGTVSLGAARTAAGVTFDTGRYLIQSSTLTVGSGGITVSSGALNGAGPATSGFTVISSVVTLGAGQTWINNSTNTIFQQLGNVDLGSNTLTLQGNLSVAGTVSGAGSIIVSAGGSPGQASVSGNNSYSGTATINSGGILTINSLGNFNATSGLGTQAGNLASNLVIDGGILRVQVSNTSSNRLFTMGAGGATLEAVNTGVNSGQILLTNTAAIAYTGVGDRTLTLGGASDDPGGSSFALAINDVGGGNGMVSLSKNGSHLWKLTGTNTYSGATTINSGTLQVGNTGSISAITIANSGFESPVQTTPGYTYTPSGADWAFVSSGVAKNTFFVNAPPEGLQAGFLQSGAASISQTVTVGADGIYQINFQAQGRVGALGPLGLIVQVDGVTVGTWSHTAVSQSQWLSYTAGVNLTAGSHTLTFLGNNTAGGDRSSSIDRVQMSQAVGSLPTNTAVNLTASGAVLDLNFTNQTVGSLAGVAGSSVINGKLTTGGDGSSTTFAGVISGIGGLTKTGSGTQTLSGTNTYTGTSTINAGTLALGADNVLPNLSDVSIGAATLDAVTFDDTLGTLDVTAAATINLGTGANLVFDGATATWAGTLNITGTFVSGSSLNFGIGGLSPAQLAAITVNGGGGPFSLDGSGFLVSGGGPTGFAAWQAANSPAGGIDEDHDNDGVSNGIEYFLVGPAPSTGFTTLPALTPAGGTFSITWTKGPGYTGNYTTDFVVETSATLTGPWTPETPGVNVTLSVNDVTYTFPEPLGTKNFARLKVTGP